jgi:hypothetical protein
VRLRIAGGSIRSRFAPGPEEGDEVLEADGIRVFVARGIVESAPDVEIDITAEHAELIVRKVG